MEEDFKKPLKELYSSHSAETIEWIDKTASTAWQYFLSWAAYILLSAIFIWFFVATNPYNQPQGEWFSRSGSLITLLAALGEALFIIKLNGLVKITHPAMLTPEIYLQRKFTPILKLTFALTLFLASIGTIIWGYGDLLYCYYA
jgi:hypothetical protein